VDGAVFDKSLASGKGGEALVVEGFREILSTVEVVDVSDNKDYQDEDVDFLWITKNLFKTDVFKVEVKTDSFPENNIFFELISNLEKGLAGCLMYTQADYLAYYYEQTGNCYVFDAQRLKKEIFNHPFYLDDSKKKKVKNRVGQGSYTTVGLAIPLADVMSCLAFKMDIKSGYGTAAA